MNMDWFHCNWCLTAPGVDGCPMDFDKFHLTHCGHILCQTCKCASLEQHEKHTILSDPNRSESQMMIKCPVCKKSSLGMSVSQAKTNPDTAIFFMDPTQTTSQVFKVMDFQARHRTQFIECLRKKTEDYKECKENLLEKQREIDTLKKENQYWQSIVAKVPEKSQRSYVPPTPQISGNVTRNLGTPGNPLRHMTSSSPALHVIHASHRKLQVDHRKLEQDYEEKCKELTDLKMHLVSCHEKLHLTEVALEEARLEEKTLHSSVGDLNSEMIIQLREIEKIQADNILKDKQMCDLEDMIQRLNDELQLCQSTPKKILRKDEFLDEDINIRRPAKEKSKELAARNYSNVNNECDTKGKSLVPPSPCVRKPKKVWVDSPTKKSRDNFS